MFSPVRNIPNVVAHVTDLGPEQKCCKLRPVGAPQQDPDQEGKS